MKSEYFKKISLFSTLSESELDIILNITKIKNFSKDETIMKEGDEGDTMYLIVEGVVEVSKSLLMKSDNDDFRKADKVLTRFKPEDHVTFGEMALIAQMPRSATIIAITDCILIEINRDDFLREIEKNPAFGVKVLLKLSELLITRVFQSNQDVVKLCTALSIALGK